MNNAIAGIHHVTAIVDDPQQNLDFYSGALGLRFVKKTVNFDVPDTYHLYFGDALGHPGTILTFFSWPHVPAGGKGTGQIGTIALAVPDGSLDYWAERLSKRGVKLQAPITRFDEQTLAFSDPDGLGLELVAYPAAAKLAYWQDGPIAEKDAVRGVHSVTLLETAHERTAWMMTEALGWRLIAEDANRRRYASPVPEQRAGIFVDVLATPDLAPGYEGVGVVHHVAYRTPNAEEQVQWRKKLLALGANVTPVLDRNYFRSIYFQEPGGVLFEIATDPPGFTVDEQPEALGTHLKLPAWLEKDRPQLEQALPILRVPDPS